MYYMYVSFRGSKISWTEIVGMRFTTGLNDFLAAPTVVLYWTTYIF